MRYTVNKGLFGTYSVKFDCPKCKIGLSCPLANAGKPDFCPDCGIQFISPGSKEKQKADEDDAIKSMAKQQAAEERKAQEQERKIATQQKKTAAENVRTQRRVEEQRQLQEDAVHRGQLAAQTVPCPYCGMQIRRRMQKCGHCGEWLAGTGHSDFVAATLGCLLGPIGLWYKGHWAAGFAWLAFYMFIFVPFVVLTAGIGIVFIPVFWIGMVVHAAVVRGRR